MQFGLCALFLFVGYDPGCSTNEVDNSAPRVVTPLGRIQGFIKIANTGRQFEAYQGVRYAEPPTGQHRFRIARPVRPWKGVLNATTFGPACVQYALIPGQEPPGHVTGAEDCLFLNIYAAIVNDDDGTRSKELLPVIFYIHGGFFQFGSASQYRPDYLLEKDVVLVTINYRLGPMGFLSTEDDVVPGNMGLKDQVIALRWVRDNIEYFGGDPSRVTIVGQSAGGASVHYHLLTPHTTGLFQRAMSISGTALDCWAQTEGSLQKAKELAASVACPTDDNQKMIDCMRGRPADQILRKVDILLPFLYEPPTPLGPVVEKGRGAFKMIERPPIETITAGSAPQDVPWITSDVSVEGLSPAAQFLANKTLLERLNNNWESIAPHMLDFNYTIPQNDHTAVANLIKKHYLGDSPIDSSTTGQIAQMVGDRLFVYNNERATRLQARVNKSPVRFYYFTYRGVHSYSETNSGTNIDFGVSHGDDLAYAMFSFFNATSTPRDLAMQKVMVNLWVSFATDGEPDMGVDWPTVSRSQEENFNHLHIAAPDDIRAETVLEIGQTKFWRTVGFRENLPRRRRNRSIS